MAEGAPAQRGQRGHADDDAEPEPEPHALRCQAAQTQGFVAAASVALRACLPASPAAAAAAAGRLLEAEEAEPDPETDPVPGPDAAEDADAAPVEEAAALSEGNACAALVAAEEAATCSGVGSGVAQQARVLCSAGNDHGAARATLEAEAEAEAADEPEEELQLEAGALPPLLLLVLRLS